MSIRRIPLRNATTNEPELLEGNVTDVLPPEESIYVDRTGKTYDASKGLPIKDLPQTGVIQVPRTSWYAFTPTPTEDRAVVGYLIDGCVPI